MLIVGKSGELENGRPAILGNGRDELKLSLRGNVMLMVNLRQRKLVEHVVTMGGVFDAD